MHMFMRVVDCIDGELARLRYQGSTFGAWLDTIGDGIGIAAFIAGATWQLVVVQGQEHWLWVGVVGVLAWLVLQGLQIGAALLTAARGTFQSIEWGHRKAKDRTRLERFMGSLELSMRIDAISTYYGLAVVAGLFVPLMVAHAAVSVGALIYFGLQLRNLRNASMVGRVA